MKYSNYFFIKPEEMFIIASPERYVIRIGKWWARRRSGIEPAVVDYDYIIKLFDALPEEFRKICLRLYWDGIKEDAYEIITKYTFNVYGLGGLFNDTEIKGVGSRGNQKRVFTTVLRNVSEQQVYNFYLEMFKMGYFEEYMKIIYRVMGYDYLKEKENYNAEKIKKLIW